jgi:hypothetical protein
MWPFKNKEKKRKPKSNIDYVLLGMAHYRELRRQIGNPPRYSPSKIIQLR